MFLLLCCKIKNQKDSKVKTQTKKHTEFCLKTAPKNYIIKGIRRNYSKMFLYMHLLTSQKLSEPKPYYSEQ